MDKEKVVKGLEEIANDKWMKIHADWYVSICRDALAMMKEQETALKRLRDTMEDMVRGNASEEVSYLLRLMDKWEQKA